MVSTSVVCKVIGIDNFTEKFKGFIGKRQSLKIISHVLKIKD